MTKKLVNIMKQKEQLALRTEVRSIYKDAIMAREMLLYPNDDWIPSTDKFIKKFISTVIKKLEPYTYSIGGTDAY